MSDEAAFLAKIAADPRAAVARLVYADWLDERSDPRAEYLRLLCAAAGWAECPDRATAVARLQELRPSLDAEWLGAVQRGIGWRLLFEANLSFGVNEYRARIEFGPPATPDQIAAAESELGVRLPPEVRAMVSECDGVRFYNAAGYIDDSEFLSLHGMVEEAQEYRLRFPPSDCDADAVVFVCGGFGLGYVVCVEDFAGFRAADVLAYDQGGDPFAPAYPSLEEFIWLWDH